MCEICIKIIGVAFAICFVAKYFLHIYIGNRNNNVLKFSVYNTPAQIFWFYLKPVSDRFKLLKRICNILFLVSMICFAIIVFFLMTFKH